MFFLFVAINENLIGADFIFSFALVKVLILNCMTAKNSYS